MPAITEYFAPGAESTVRPSEVGEQAITRAGMMGERRAAISADIRERGEQNMVKGIETFAEAGIHTGTDIAKLHEENMQFTDATAWAKNSSDLQLQTHQDVNKLVAAGDPDAISKYYNETFKPKLAALMQAASTQEGQKRQLEEGAYLDRDMQHQIVSAASITQAEKTISQADVTGRNLSQLVSTNTAALPQARQTWTALRDAALQSGNLAPEEVAHIKEHFDQGLQQLDTSGFQGMLVANPNKAAAMVKSGMFPNLPAHINVAQAVQEANQRSQEATERGMIIQDMHDRQVSRQVTNSWLKDNMTEGPGGMIVMGPNAWKSLATGGNGMQPADRIEAMRLVDTSLTTMREAADRAAKGETITTDPALRDTILSNFSKSVLDKDFPTQLSIMQDHMAGKLNNEDTMWMMRMSEAAEHDPQVATGLRMVSEDNPTIKSGMDMAKQQLIGSAPQNQGPGGAWGLNPVISAKTDQFRIDTLRTLQNAILNHQDITPYLDPTSKLYVFSQAKVAQYQATQEELQNRLVAPPPKPGEPGKATPPKEDIGSVIGRFLTFPPPANRGE